MRQDSLLETQKLVREADTQLYSIGIFDSFEYRSRTPEELSGPSLLTEVTELTGGRAFTVEDVNELPDIATKIGSELRRTTVGFTTGALDGYGLRGHWPARPPP
jgi:hypothetical protein